MKDLILAFSIILGSQGGQAGCSHWDILGGTLPERVDGRTASHEEMMRAQARTEAYIRRLEQTIESCRPANFQHNDLIDAMELAAERYNRALSLYRQRMAEQASR